MEIGYGPYEVKRYDGKKVVAVISFYDWMEALNWGRRWMDSRIGHTSTVTGWFSKAESYKGKAGYETHQLR
jgi:hypothetical protein